MWILCVSSAHRDRSLVFCSGWDDRATRSRAPQGRLFPLSRDDLVECAALLDSVRRGELDRISIPEQPLDVLAQQIVAEVACAGMAARTRSMRGCAAPGLIAS